MTSTNIPNRVGPRPTFTANPYDGTIAHNVHPDVVEWFINWRESDDAGAAPEWIAAMERNRALASMGARCLHTNGNHTVWEMPHATVTVALCPPAVTTTNRV